MGVPRLGVAPHLHLSRRGHRAKRLLVRPVPMWVHSSRPRGRARETSHHGLMPRRLLCLHGHFYQPPRENPWIEEIEVQDSADPFHDWNLRIAAECYAPNGAARLKNAADRIVDIVDSYLHL